MSMHVKEDLRYWSRQVDEMHYYQMCLLSKIQTIMEETGVLHVSFTRNCMNCKHLKANWQTGEITCVRNSTPDEKEWPCFEQRHIHDTFVVNR